MDLTRRGFAGSLAGAVGGGSMYATGNQVHDHGPQATNRTLTVKELTATEVAEIERTNRELNEAVDRRDEFYSELLKRYGSSDGIDVSFEQNYVFIRDRRAEVAKKRAAYEAMEAQSMRAGRVR